MNDLQQKIIKFLNNGEHSTSKIAGFIGINYYVALRNLLDLKSNGLVERNDTPMATYWRLKK